MKVSADIRDLIQLDDAMDDETLHFGPNGGLLFCMEYKHFFSILKELDCFKHSKLLKGILLKISNG